MRFKKTMICSLCIGLLLVTGCTAKLKNGEEVVASVKGGNITADALYGKIKDRFARDILIDMIDRAILDKKYKTDATLDAQIKSQIDSIKQQTGADNFLSAIKNEWGLNSEAELYSFIEITLKRNNAIKDYVKKSITDAEVNAYYDKETVGDIRVSHILVKAATTDSMTASEKAAKETEALNKAKDIIKELNNGADFATTAKAYSEDTGSAANGGDVGWLNKTDTNWDQAFRYAAYDLEKGKYSTEPVKSAFGYHIILKTDTKDKPTLKQAKESILTSIAENKLTNDNKLSYVAIEAVRKENKLVIKDSELKKQYDAYMAELQK